MPGYRELDVLLAENQSALGTAVATLDNNDYRAVDNQFVVKFVQNGNPINIASGGFGQNRWVPGTHYYEVEASLPVIPTGSTTQPSVGDFLICSGMTETVATNKHTYAPSNDPATDWVDQTVWGYMGVTATGDSVISKAHSVMYSWVLSGELGGIPLLKFSGRGPTTAIPTAGNYVSGTLTQPASSMISVIKATTMKVCDIVFRIVNFEIDAGNNVVLLPDPSATGGYYRTAISTRESTWKAQVLIEDMSAKEPYTSLNAGTVGDFEMTFGDAGSRISVVSGTDKCEITAVAEADSDGVKVFDLSGIFVDNSFQLIINED